jgi:hypothetical protein
MRCKTSAASARLVQRSAGLVRKHFWSTLTTPPGMAGKTGSVGPISRYPINASGAALPVIQVTSPVNISRTETPQLHMSVLRERGRPSACSGEQ